MTSSLRMLSDRWMKKAISPFVPGKRLTNRNAPCKLEIIHFVTSLFTNLDLYLIAECATNPLKVKRKVCFLSWLCMMIDYLELKIYVSFAAQTLD